MRVRRVFVLLTLVACGAFESVGGAPADGGAGVVVDGGDGGVPVSSAVTTDAAAGGCARRGDVCVLYEPTSRLDDEYPFAIATDETFVYWLAVTAPRADAAVSGAASAGTGLPRVWRARKDGSASTLLYQGDAPVRARALALNGATVRFAQTAANKTRLISIDRACTGLGVGAKPCVPLDSRELAVGPIVKMVPGDATSVWLLEEDGEAWRADESNKLTSLGHSMGALVEPELERSSQQLLLAGRNRSELRGYAVDGGARLTTMTLPSLEPGILGCASDDKEVFAFRGDNGIWRGAALVNDGGATLWAAGAAGFADMVLDGERVYLGSSTPGAVYAFQRSNGERTTIATTSTLHLAVDADGLYWGEHRAQGTAVSPGTIRRLVK